MVPFSFLAKSNDKSPFPLPSVKHCHFHINFMSFMSENYACDISEKRDMPR